jgi:probable phosphoglycerate mutase
VTTYRKIFLVRHAETAWNAEGRWQGQHDVPLSDRGRDQARALGLRLAGTALGSAFCSTLGRTRETADLVLGDRLRAEAVPDLVEICYGAWEGVSDDEVSVRWPDLHRKWREAPHEMRMIDGESLADVERRVVPALERIVETTEGDVLVVAHGGVNRLLLGHVLRIPHASFWRMQQRPTAVNVLEVPAGRPGPEALLAARVGLLNCTAHL